MVKIEIDLSTRCRACLAEEPEMHHLYSDFDQGLTLANILENTTTFHVDENDDVPPYLCENCTTVVVDFYNFKTVYQENENYMNSLVNNCNEDGVIVKKEEIEVFSNLGKEKEGIDMRDLSEKDSQENVTGELTAEYVSPEDLFTQKIDLNDEIYNGQNQHVELKEYIKYNCTECDEWFVMTSAFHHHLKERHTISENDFDNHCRKTKLEVPVVKTIEPEISVEAVPDSYVCKTCKEEFDNNFELQKHSKKHKNFICECCGAAFFKKCHMNDHKEIHLTVRRYVCQFCNKTFRLRTAFTKHKRIHTHPREVICEVCGKRFNDKSTMRTHHKLKHIRSREFHCNCCGLSFPLKSTLNKHMSRRHEGNREKKFSCDICEVSYRDKSSLSRHNLVKHSGCFKKPTCTICGKGYTTTTKLKKHMIRYHNNC